MRVHLSESTHFLSQSGFSLATHAGIHARRGPHAVKLQAMQQPAASIPTPPPTFAGMLAAMADPGQKRPPVRDLDGLEDDVTTLSYERALREHGRYRAPDFSGPEPDMSWNAGSVRIFEALPAAERQADAIEATMPAVYAGAGAETAGAEGAFSAADRHLKRASITIRLSRVECAQLRARAAEAGLTVSAYLRSCSVEAESLRALVKDTLEQLKSSVSRENPAEMSVAPRSWRKWLTWFWPHLRPRERIAL